MTSPGNDQTKAKLVLMGDGSVRTGFATALDTEMDRTLIERASHLTHGPARIRARVDPSLVKRALIAHDLLLKRRRVVRGEATRIGQTGVTQMSGSGSIRGCAPPRWRKALRRGIWRPAGMR